MVGPVGTLWSLSRVLQSCFELPGGGREAPEGVQISGAEKEGNLGGCPGLGPGAPLRVRRYLGCAVEIFRGSLGGVLNAFLGPLGGASCGPLGASGRT